MNGFRIEYRGEWFLPQVISRSTTDDFTAARSSLFPKDKLNEGGGLNMLKRLFIWAEIPVSNMERAETFYKRILQVEMQSMPIGDSEYSFFPVQEQHNGGSLVKGPRHKPSKDGISLYLDGSPDLAAILSRVNDAGGQVIMEKTFAGEHAGYLGMFIDSEGNRIGLQHL